MSRRWKIAIACVLGALAPLLMAPTGGIPAFLRVSSIGVNAPPGAAGVANISGPINLFPSGGGSGTLNIATSGSGATGSIILGNATGGTTGQILVKAGTGNSLINFATNGSIRGNLGAAGTAGALMSDGVLGDLQLYTNSAASIRLSTNGALTTTANFDSTGGLTLTGGLTAGSTISGPGSGLTSLNGTNISSGTINDARLSTNVALLNGSQNFTAAPTIGGSLICRADGTNCPLAQTSGSFTSTLSSGCTTTPTATISWVKVGSMVTLDWPANSWSCTSNTTTKNTDASLPASIRPASTNKCAASGFSVQNNTVAAAGNVVVTTAGALNFGLNATGTGATNCGGPNATNAGTWAVDRLSVTYSIL